MEGGTYQFAEVDNWEFTYSANVVKVSTDQADLTGNFVNDFTGDTLKLYLGDWNGSSAWTILDNTNADAYTGFGEGLTVKFANSAADPLDDMSWNSNGYYSAAGEGYEYRLGLNGTRMELTKVSTIA